MWGEKGDWGNKIAERPLLKINGFEAKFKALFLKLFLPDLIRAHFTNGFHFHHLTYSDQ